MAEDLRLGGLGLTDDLPLPPPPGGAANWPTVPIPLSDLPSIPIPLNDLPSQPVPDLFF